MTRRLALLLALAVLAACTFESVFAVEVRCLNDRVPYSAVTDTITVAHCSTVDSLALHPLPTNPGLRDSAPR